MVDTRLYIVTLVAVLVFFGLGVLVGIGITRQPTAEQLYRRIEQQLKRYREETAKELLKRDERLRQLEGELAALRHRLRLSDQFVEGLLPSLVRNRLQFRNIAFVLRTSDADGELVTQVRSWLQRAGANVPLQLTLFPDAIAQADEMQWRKVAETLGLVAEQAKTEAVKIGVWKRIALLLRYGDQQDTWRKLAKMGWLQVSGDPKTPVGSVVFVVGTGDWEQEQVQVVDLPFLKALSNTGVRVVVVARTGISDETFALYQTGDWGTVSHVETPLGVLSLVAALTERPDHYGLDGNAHHPFPDLEWVLATK